jgi:hypothetical protein
MQKLILFSIAIFTTITLMTGCGENGNGTTTEVSSQDVTNVSDSTLTTSEVVSDTTKK